jgi:hypothetical protein
MNRIDWEVPVVALSITFATCIFIMSIFCVTYLSTEQRYTCMEMFADKPTSEIVQLCK